MFYLEENTWRFKDLEYCDYWLVLKPIYGNIIITLYFDGKPMIMEEMLQESEIHPTEVLITCLFFLDVLR